MTENVEVTLVRVEDALPVLSATPAVLRSLLEPLSAEWLEFHEDAQAWSPRRVLVHFIQNEIANWIPRAKVALSAGEERKFVPYQPQAEQDDGIDMRELLSKFAALRKDNLTALRDFHLKEEDYLRTAEHPSLGIVTLGQLLATWVVHDLNHIHQIVKSLAKRNTAAVGPWKQYLGILEI
ncbi:MAG: DinB family protein [Anaerolineales bacterium]